MTTTLNAATFMGKNFSTIQSVVKNHESLTLKQMFDVTTQLVNNQEEINCLDKILYGKNSWTRLSLLINEMVINLQSTKVSVSSDSVLCLGKFFNIPNPTKLGRTELQEAEPREAAEIMMLSTESRLKSSGTFSQDSQRCSSAIKSVIFGAIWDKHQKISQEEFSFMSMFNDISCGRKDNKDVCLANAEIVKVLAKKFDVGQWSFIGPGSEKKWYSSENSPQGAWDNIAGEMLLEFA